MATECPQSFQEFMSEIEKFLHGNDIGILKDVLQRLESDLKTRRLNIFIGIILCLAVYLTIGHNAHFLCNFIGFIYPAMVFMNNIEEGHLHREQAKWTAYWVIYNGLIVMEYLFSMITNISLPFYWLVKCYVLILCFVPVPWNGSDKFYQVYIQPFMQHHGHKVEEFATKTVSNKFVLLMSSIVFGLQFNCTIIGFAYPAYMSLRLLENQTQFCMERSYWLTYWLVYSAFGVLEFLHHIMWIPLYWHVKFVVLLTCMKPEILKLCYTKIFMFIMKFRPVHITRLSFNRFVHFLLTVRLPTEGVNTNRPAPVNPSAPAQPNQNDFPRNQNTESKEPAEGEQNELTSEMNTPVVKAVLEMDVGERYVRRAIRKKLESDGEMFTSSEELLEAVFNLNNNGQMETGEADMTVRGEVVRDFLDISPHHTAGSVDGTDSQSLEEENRSLREQRLCKICMEEDVEVVFVPCGHLVCCHKCTMNLMECPICRTSIESFMRTYLS